MNYTIMPGAHLLLRGAGGDWHKITAIPGPPPGGQCCHCGQRFTTREEGQEHAKTCEANPVRKESRELRAELQRVIEQRDAARGELRIVIDERDAWRQYVTKIRNERDDARAELVQERKSHAETAASRDSIAKDLADQIERARCDAEEAESQRLADRAELERERKAHAETAAALAKASTADLANQLATAKALYNERGEELRKAQVACADLRIRYNRMEHAAKSAARMFTEATR